MTPAQLKEIRERCEKATPGPWLAGNRAVGTADENLEWNERLVEEADASTGNDLKFIAHSRSDLPALLSEVDRLQKRVDELEFQQRCVTIGRVP